MKTMDKIISFAWIAFISAVLGSPVSAQSTISGSPANDTILTPEQERIMLENTFVNPSLREFIYHNDYDRLVMAKEKALDMLASLGDDAYGIKEREMVKRLLTADELEFSSQELSAYRKVRSIQVNNLGIFSYPYFSCRFKTKDGKTFFEKTAGSQRKSGYIYDNMPASKIFLGAWSVNNDPQTAYDDGPNAEAGVLYKIGAKKLMMLFVTPNRSFEIYEIISR